MKAFPVRRCKECDGQITERFVGTEGFSVCEDCQNVEGAEYESLEDVDGRRYIEDDLLDTGE